MRPSPLSCGTTSWLLATAIKMRVCNSYWSTFLGCFTMHSAALTPSPVTGSITSVVDSGRTRNKSNVSSFYFPQSAAKLVLWFHLVCLIHSINTLYLKFDILKSIFFSSLMHDFSGLSLSVLSVGAIYYPSPGNMNSTSQSVTKSKEAWTQPPGPWIILFSVCSVAPSIILIMILACFYHPYGVLLYYFDPYGI